MKRYVQLSLITISVFVAAIAGWRYATAFQVMDNELIEYNTGQHCNATNECGRGGCSGELCGSGGGGTICFRDFGFWEQYKGKSCTCVENICSWSKPLVDGSRLTTWGSKIFK